MTGFFGRMADRATGTEQVARLRPVSRFEEVPADPAEAVRAAGGEPTGAPRMLAGRESGPQAATGSQVIAADPQPGAVPSAVPRPARSPSRPAPIPPNAGEIGPGAPGAAEPPPAPVVQPAPTGTARPAHRQRAPEGMSPAGLDGEVVQPAASHSATPPAGSRPVRPASVDHGPALDGQRPVPAVATGSVGRQHRAGVAASDLDVGAPIDSNSRQAAADDLRAGRAAEPRRPKPEESLPAQPLPAQPLPALPLPAAVLPAQPLPGQLLPGQVLPALVERGLVPPGTPIEWADEPLTAENTPRVRVQRPSGSWPAGRDLESPRQSGGQPGTHLGTRFEVRIERVEVITAPAPPTPAPRPVPASGVDHAAYLARRRGQR